jgi:hypothetical protein
VAFSSFSACARPSISERVDIWRIEGLLTQTLYRNGCNVSKIITSIGQNPFTETIYFRKYSVCEGFLGENTRLRELRRRVDFGFFWAIWGNFGLLGAVFA